MSKIFIKEDCVLINGDSARIVFSNDEKYPVNSVIIVVRPPKANPDIASLLVGVNKYYLVPKSLILGIIV